MVFESQEIGLVMSDNENKVTMAAKLLSDAWCSYTVIDEMPTNLYPDDLAEAAIIQTELAKLIGEQVVGWKVGGSPGPMVGRIFKSHCFFGDTELPSRLLVHRPAVECEIAFKLEKSFPPRSSTYHRNEVIDGATLVFTVELVGTRFRDGKHIPDTEYERLAIVADNSAGLGLIVGPTIQDWRNLDLLGIPVELRMNGGNPMPLNPLESRFDPVATLTWLINELSTLGIGTTEGQVVTTGSATVLQPILPGRNAEVRFGDFGNLQVSLKAN